MGPRSLRVALAPADLFDASALSAASDQREAWLAWSSTPCFCAIDPGLRQGLPRHDPKDCLKPRRLGLLGLLFCQSREGGPPLQVTRRSFGLQWRQAGFVSDIWEPAQGSVAQRP